MKDYQKTPSTSGVLILFIISWALCQCSVFKPNKKAEKKDIPARFLYVSHTRLDRNDSVNQKIYQLDFSEYEYLLLGGDLADQSFENEQIITHLESVFSISSKKTLWSVGNHDRTSDHRFLKYTNKHKYGLYKFRDLSFIVLDSQDSLSSIVGKQKEFLLTVLDNITTKKVILMSHKLIFMDQHPILDDLINEICNGKKGDCYYCHNTNNFQKEIYPRLVQSKREGKEIFWIGGDLGSKKSTFEYVDDQGIIYLGNGMNADSLNNYVLEFVNNAQLEYKFIHVDSLIQRQNLSKIR